MVINKLSVVIIFCTTLFGTNACYRDKEDLPEKCLIPLPQEVVEREGVFHCTPGTIISLYSSDLTSEIITLQETFIKIFGKPLKVIEAKSKKKNKLANEIKLEISNSLNDRESIGQEGYHLQVEKKGLKITATTPTGIFYGIQTLRQLIILFSDQQDINKTIKINCLRIHDKPKFEWRGMMLDPARYFLPIELLKKQINIMCFYKMNRLHLHLTDDHGWTVEMVKYPELNNQEKWPAAYRRRHNGNRYTREEIKDLVTYAKERHIIIMPEFDQPGHNTILALVKPDILCKTNPYRTDKNAAPDFPNEEKASEPIRAQLEGCVGNEETLHVYENILTELMELFPSRYIHIGGDEYHGCHWATCPDCQRLIKEKGLEKKYDTQERRALFANCKGEKKKYILYLYLMNHLADFVTSKGRIPVLWDDLAWRGNFPKDAILMQWHYKGGGDAWQRIKTPENPAVEATLAGHQAIVAPYSHLYFNRDKSLNDVYSFNPIPEELKDEAKKKLILGPHACIWNQPVDSVFAKSFPSFYALSQIGWSCDTTKNFTDFENRVKIQNSVNVPGVKEQ